MQQWIDTGMLWNLFLFKPRGILSGSPTTKRFNAKDIFDTTYSAWQEGCKAIIISSVQKDDLKE